jgi:hypothetical protein
MEAAVIAALVAGAVSLVGFLVNLRIAKETRRSAREQPSIAASVRLAEDAISELKGYARQTELLRSACWDLWTKARYATSLVDYEALEKSVVRFDGAWEEYFNAWANVKPTVNNETDLELVQKLRHETREVSTRLKRQLTEPPTRSGVTAVVDELRRLLDLLEGMIVLIRNIRQEAIERLGGADATDR